MNLVLSLTEQCNLRCSYCYYRESQSARSLVMSDDVLRQSIQFAYEMSLAHKQNNFNITFFGGEPLLCKEAILKGVEFAKQLNAENVRLRFAVNTNGTLLDSPTLDYFQKENFRIFLSLDGPQDVHDSARRFPNGKGSFNTIQPFLSGLSKMDSVILRVISRKYLNGLADSIRFIHSLGFKNISTATDFD
ncbi:MAG: radical SAM protein [Fibrobacteraceae bacterium]|nr:radical SAM protein [Fibrobacteraceae bacterium]